MSRSRRIVLQGVFVLLGGAVSLSSPRRASAAPTLACGPECENDCMSPPNDLSCGACGAETQCDVVDNCMGDFGAHGLWYCAPAS